MNILSGVISNRRGKLKFLGLQKDPSLSQFCPLVGHPNLPIRKTLTRVIGLLTVMILKRVTESIFFKVTNLQRVSLKMKKRWQTL